MPRRSGCTPTTQNDATITRRAVMERLPAALAQTITGTARGPERTGQDAPHVIGADSGDVALRKSFAVTLPPVAASMRRRCLGAGKRSARR